MDQVLAKLINNSLISTGVSGSDVSELIVGCAYQRDENWTYGGRHPVFLANLPFEIPSMAVDRACASSMNAVSIGAMEIATGLSDLVLAGGIEHMTHVPRLSNKLCTPLLDDASYAGFRMKEAYSMGLTAENLADLKGISRQEMDAYSLESHRRASEAISSHFFDKEILPVQVTIGGESRVVSSDQSVRKDTTMDALSQLQPVFKEGGKITAGNSSPLNAGASLVMLASEEKVNASGLEPLAELTTFSSAGVPPYLMGLGPVPATEKLLKKQGLQADDIDVWEINEAFAVVVLNAIRELGIEPHKVNIHGGAIAIGHPLGASGARLIGTAARILQEKKKDRAIATLCVGGGQGFATLVERV